LPSYWLLKTEPGEYSYADLAREGRAEWDGVTNPTAQKNMRAMKVDDLCVIYHTGDEKRAVGLARVVSDAYPDPKDGSGRLVLVDLAPERVLARATTLAEIRQNPLFEQSPLTRIPRLSVVPLAPAQFEALAGPG
jgi:predicted RNA-binding protein with PUA-like domain